MQYQSIYSSNFKIGKTDHKYGKKLHTQKYLLTLEIKNSRENKGK